MSARDPDKFYLVRGSTLDRIESALDDLWSGNNIQRGSGIRLRKGGKNAGLMIAASAVTSPPAVAPTSLPPTWPFKIYNTSTGPYGKVQINGGDGAAAVLGPGSAVATIGGSPTDTTSGTPARYPQLAITSNGLVVAKFYITINGLNNQVTVTSTEIGFNTTMPAGDSSTPPSYGTVLLATISNYSVDGSGNVHFTVNDANAGSGLTTVIYCGGAMTVL